MRWRRFGKLWGPQVISSGSFTHASYPTPFVLTEGLVRVYVTCRDVTGRGRPFWVDVALDGVPEVAGWSESPLLDLGAPGMFDQDGVACTSIVKDSSDSLLMFYSGFERFGSRYYRLLTGMAESQDGGYTFRKLSQVPALERTDGQTLFRCGAFVWQQSGRWNMLYSGGDRWIQASHRNEPSYHLYHAQSSNPRIWNDCGEKVVDASSRFFGVGRPWPFSPDWTPAVLLVSVRDSVSRRYRMARLPFDGVRVLGQPTADIGLEPDGITDRITTVHAATVTISDRTFCFYTGDDFGRDGFSVAELEDD